MKENKMYLKYSVVIPCYNEAENVILLDKEIKKVMNSLIEKDSKAEKSKEEKATYEIIYVNDGSSDKTLESLKKLANVKIINLNRNYGQATALDAGFKASEGDFVISLDADMQNDPNDIPKLLDKLEKDDLDVVAGWRKKRKDSSGIKILTKTGRLFRRFLIHDSVHDTGCTLRVYRKAAVKSLDLQGEMHRYILALLRWKGFKIGELEVNHRVRANGETKYTYMKAIRGFIDLVYIWFIEKYSQRPLHMFGAAGIFSFGTGTLIEAIMFYLRFFRSVDLSSNAWFLLGIFLMITGVLLFSFGITLDIVMKMHLNTSPYEKRYYIRDVIHTY